MAVRKQEFDDKDQQNQKPAKRSRITFDVSPDLRRRIKVAAADNNASIGEYLGHIIEQAIPEETNKTEQPRHPVTRKSSERLHMLREKTLADRKGKPFEDSTEMIRQMREERTQYLEDASRGDVQKEI
ncbi:MAG: hypothetical protein NVS4B11_03870 [Ktedonobacteraceae bacterium]